MKQINTKINSDTNEKFSSSSLSSQENSTNLIESFKDSSLIINETEKSNDLSILPLETDNKLSKSSTIFFVNSKKIKDWNVEDIRDINDKIIYFHTPLMYVPFGIEKEYNNYIIKLQFKGLKNNTNPEMLNFYNSIIHFENEIINIKNIDKNNFKSQIIYKNNYDDLLIIKINKKFYNIEIVNQKSEIKNIFDIKKKSEIECKLHVDNLWDNGKIITTKFIVDKIIIQDT